MEELSKILSGGEIVERVSIEKTHHDLQFLTKLENLEVGDILYYRNISDSDYVYSGIGCICKIVSFKVENISDRTHIKVQVCEYDIETREWSDKISSINEVLLRYDKLSTPLEEMFSKSASVLNGTYTPTHTKSLSTDTQLIGRASKTQLIALQDQASSQKEKMQTLQSFVAIQIREQKKELDRIKKSLQVWVGEIHEVIEKINHAITVIELYMGVEEEIHHIRVGVPCDCTEPISFRQLAIYMDEEIGVWEDGGLDFSNIDEFDKWILDNDNFEKVLPEKKGVVVLHPRRLGKDYGDYDDNRILNDKNRSMTYFLIRNGENLHRIYTDKLVVRDRLFPKKSEFQEVREKAYYNADKAIENTTRQYRRILFFMQGLIDRTEVFYPLPEKKPTLININDNQEDIRLIYDGDDNLLPDGRLLFSEWRKTINEKIVVGSRIVICDNIRSCISSKYRSSYFIKQYKEYDQPSLPKPGIYEVVEHQSTTIQRIYKPESIVFEEENVNKIVRKFPSKYTYYDEYLIKVGDPKMVIQYEDDRTKYSRDGMDSYKNKVSFRIDLPEHFILNYDEISLEDVDFYLHDRLNRSFYLQSMPTLKRIKTLRKEELKQEGYFVDMLLSQLKLEPTNLNRDIVFGYIEWWKYKNKYKRGLTKDDSKALRMIIKKYKSIES